MKNLFVIALLCIGFAGVANATPISCAVLMYSNTSGNTGTTCTVNPDPGFFISALTLTGTDDYTGLEAGNPVVSFSATLVQTVTLFSETYCNVSTGPTASIPCSIVTLPAATVAGLDLTSFSVYLSNASNTVSGGSVVGSSIVLHLGFGETQDPVPPPPAPEPSSLLMLSSGLLGLGFLKRKVF